MIQLIKDLYLTNRSFVTDDYDMCLDYIKKKILPIRIHTYESGRLIWDSWQVPQKWIIDEAVIKDEDRVLLNIEDHPLHLIAYSASFQGEISTAELKKHIFTHSKNKDAIPWHFRQNYRPWEQNWGFCASKRFVEQLKKEKYYVSIKTQLKDDFMKVGEYHIQGTKKQTIVFLAHLCHSGMANDDLAGVAAGLEIMKRLKQKKTLKYSYKLLIVQEMIGTAAYLEQRVINDMEYGIFLEMPGNNNRLAVQKSYSGDTLIDRIAQYQLKQMHKDGEIFGFRELVQNDEMIMESPGYEIPTISLSRYPYDEYHTQFDNPNIISEKKMGNFVDFAIEITSIFEKNFIPKRTFTGLPSLANPKYNLYIDPGQEALDKANFDINPNLVKFRDYIFRMLDGTHSAFDIAERFELDYNFVHNYLNRFYEKNLIEKIQI